MSRVVQALANLVKQIQEFPFSEELIVTSLGVSRVALLGVHEFTLLQPMKQDREQSEEDVRSNSCV